jgi:hypothetical protein
MESQLSSSQTRWWISSPWASTGMSLRSSLISGTALLGYENWYLHENILDSRFTIVHVYVTTRKNGASDRSARAGKIVDDVASKKRLSQRKLRNLRWKIMLGWPYPTMDLKSHHMSAGLIQSDMVWWLTEEDNNGNVPNYDFSRAIERKVRWVTHLLVASGIMHPIGQGSTHRGEAPRTKL